MESPIHSQTSANYTNYTHFHPDPTNKQNDRKCSNAEGDTAKILHTNPSVSPNAHHNHYRLANEFHPPYHRTQQVHNQGFGHEGNIDHQNSNSNYPFPFSLNYNQHFQSVDEPHELPRNRDQPLPQVDADFSLWNPPRVWSRTTKWGDAGFLWFIPRTWLVLLTLKRWISVDALSIV